MVVVGKVKEVNLDDKTIVVVDPRTDEAHTVMIGDHSEIQLGRGRTIPSLGSCPARL